jgi:hypothetical protein
MGGVDIADQLCAKFSTQLRGCHNWFPLFNWCLDIAIVNAFVLWETGLSHYDKKNLKSRHRQFRESIIDSLIRGAQSEVIPKTYMTKNTLLPTCRLDKPRGLHVL